MNGDVAMKVPSDRWLSLLLWAILVWLAWRFVVLLTVRDPGPAEKPVPTNPRQRFPSESQPK